VLSDYRPGVPSGVTGLILGYLFGRVHVGRQTSGRLDQLRRDYDELAVMLEATSMTAPTTTPVPPRTRQKPASPTGTRHYGTQTSVGRTGSGRYPALDRHSDAWRRTNATSRR
jgi:hypothetical protein